ncbi:MAG TPA: tetratricopeptide repeat protein [Candidatus Dependentiae bacterium]|nr:tetratricopeptide repeat protein [Candidatus Dependentiae bacterium]
MKKIMIMYMALCSLYICAGTIQEKFLQANVAYQEGQVQQALALYDAIEPKGPAINYNIGNCYFRLGDYAQAILFWTRAQKNASWRDFSKLDSEIDRAYALLAIPREIPFVSRIAQFFTRICSPCSLFALQILFLICWFAVCWYLPSLYRRKKYSVLSFLFVIVVSLGLLLYVKHCSCISYALVSKNSISVYAGPGHDYAPLTEAKILDSVRIVERRNEWYKVYIRRCGYGWVDGTEIFVI